MKKKNGEYLQKNNRKQMKIWKPMQTFLLPKETIKDNERNGVSHWSL